jgi:hypothetical protein
VNPRACHETLMIDAGDREEAHRRGGRRPGRAGLCHDGGTTRPFEVTLFDAGDDRRAVQHRQAGAGQGGVYETLRYFDRNER